MQPTASAAPEIDKAGPKYRREESDFTLRHSVAIIDMLDF
jgi:hypothetical protein